MNHRENLEENIKAVRKLKNHSFDLRHISKDTKKLIGSLGVIGSLAESITGVLQDPSDTNYQTCSMAAERLKVSVPRLEESFSYFKDTEKRNLGLTWDAELSKDFYTVYRDFIFLCNCLDGVFASFMDAHGERDKLVGVVEDEMDSLRTKAGKLQVHSLHDLIAGPLGLLTSFEALDSLIGGALMSFGDEYNRFSMDVDDYRRQVARLLESTAFYSGSDGTDINHVWWQMIDEDGDRLVQSIEDALSSSEDLVRVFTNASRE